MEVNFPSDIERQLHDAAAKSGLVAEDLVRDVVTSYVRELAEARTLLDSRYDDLASGRVQLIDEEEAHRRLRAKSATRRAGLP